MLQEYQLKNNQYLFFDKVWFSLHQQTLLWLCNAPLVKYWFRWILRIHNYDCPFKIRIEKIMPHYYVFDRKIVLTDHIVYKNGKKEVFNPNLKKHLLLKKRGVKIEKHLATFEKYDFRTHNKFSKRICYAFFLLWWLFHQWDILIANRFIPSWNLGFDTFYPDPNPETTSTDDMAYDETVGTFAALRAAAGSAATVDTASTTFALLRATAVANQYNRMDRGHWLFDTSPLTATPTSATFSFYGDAKLDDFGSGALALVSSNPASNTSIAAGDYDAVGSTRFATDITISAFSTSAYNDWALNASGIAAIDIAGITKFAGRTAWDFDNSAPTWSSGAVAYGNGVYADAAGTTTDPKLVTTIITTNASMMFAND